MRVAQNRKLLMSDSGFEPVNPWEEIDQVEGSSAA